MKVKSIEVSRLFNSGNYENHKIGIVVELNQDESELEAIKKANEFVEQFKPKEKISDYEYENAKKITENPYDFSQKRIDQANIIIKNYLNQDDYMPF
jgi:hypothetical protein